MRRLSFRWWLVFIFLCVVGFTQPAEARMEYALPGEKNLILEGFLENYTIMRSKDFRFSKQMQLTSFRNTAQFEITVENLLKNWGFIDRVDFFNKSPVFKQVLYGKLKLSSITHRGQLHLFAEAKIL